MPTWTEGIVDTGCIAANGSSIAVADRAGSLYGSDDFRARLVTQIQRTAYPSGVLICEEGDYFTNRVFNPLLRSLI